MVRRGVHSASIAAEVVPMEPNVTVLRAAGPGRAPEPAPRFHVIPTAANAVGAFAGETYNHAADRGALERRRGGSGMSKTER